MVCTIRLENGSPPSNLNQSKWTASWVHRMFILTTTMQHGLNPQFSGPWTLFARWRWRWAWAWARGYGNRKMGRSTIIFWAQLITGTSTFEVKYCKIRIYEVQLLSAQSHLRSDKSGRQSGSINSGTSALKNRALMHKDSIISHLAVNCSIPIQVKILRERIQRWCLIKI